MFIYHFNRLIRNRVLWGIFAIFIAMAFVGAGSCMKQPQDGQNAGKINGKSITADDFRLTVRAVRGFGQNRDNETSAASVDRRAWEQLAARELAEANGIHPRAKEVQNALREAEPFQGPNGFDINRYRAIIQQQGFTPAIYEQLVSQQIALSKNAALVQTANWISPMELEDELAGMTDLFTVRTFTISNTYANAKMELTDDDYLKFYEENKESFALPDQVSVRYIEVPVSNYMASITINEDDMLAYYDDNIDRFQRSTTNNTTEVIPFDEVKTKVEDELKLEQALYCAETNLKFTIYGALADNQTISLEKTAEDKGVKIKTSPLFGASDQLFWAQNAEEFIATSFELDPEREDSRYGIVAGKDVVYVLEQLKKTEAHTPKFKSVLNKVRPRALEKARSEAFKKYTDSLNEEISELLKAGKSIADAAKAKAMNVSTSITYSVNTIRNQQFENSFSIAYGSMNLKQGEISKAIPTSAIEALLIYVEERKPGDALSAEMMRPQVRSGIARRRATDIFSEWLAWNLKQQDFKPARALIDEDADDDASLSSSSEDDDEA